MSAHFTSSFFTLWNNEALNDLLCDEVPAGTLQFNSNSRLIRRIHQSRRRPHHLFSNQIRDRDCRLFNRPRSQHIINPPRHPGRRFLPDDWRKLEHLNLVSVLSLKSLLSLQTPPKYPSARQVESPPLPVQRVGFGHQQCEICACSSVSPQSLLRCRESPPFSERRVGFLPSPGRLVRSPRPPGRRFLSCRRRKPDGSSSAPLPSLQEFAESSSPLSVFDNKQGAKSLKVPSTKNSLTHNEKGAEPLKEASTKNSPLYCHRPPGCQYFVRMKIIPEYSQVPPWWDEFDCDEIWKRPCPPVSSPNLKGQLGASSSSAQLDESDEIIKHPSLPVPSPNLKNQPGASSSSAQLDESDEIIKHPSLPVPSPNLKNQPGASSSSAQLDEYDEIIKHPSLPVPSTNLKNQPGASSSSAQLDESDEIIKHPSLPVPSPNLKNQPGASSSSAQLDESDEIIKHPSLPVPSPNLKNQPGASSSSAQLDESDEIIKHPSLPVPSPNLKNQPGASSSSAQLDEYDEIIKHPSLPVPSTNLKNQPGASSSSAQLDEYDEIIKRPSLPSPNLKSQPGTSSSLAWWNELVVDQEVPSLPESSPQSHSSSQVPPNDSEHCELSELISSLSLQEYQVCTTDTMFSFPHYPNPPVIRPFPSPMGWMWSFRSPQYSPPQLEPELELQQDLDVQHPLAPRAASEQDQVVPGEEASTKRNADAGADEDAYEDADSLVQTPPSQFLRDTQFIVPPLTPPPTPSLSPPHH